MPLNSVDLIGRLTKDPELRYTSGEGIAVCSFALAVDRNYKKADGSRETDFVPCVLWRNQAENLAKYFTKGDEVMIHGGSLQTRQYEDREGTKRSVTEAELECVLPRQRSCRH
jgi:single-strand DNA-binding protein